MSSHKGRLEGGGGGGGGGGEELLVAKLLITNISNIATGMFNKSEPLETYPSEGFR